MLAYGMLCNPYFRPLGSFWDWWLTCLYL
jgi:hypothetical protein